MVRKYGTTLMLLKKNKTAPGSIPTDLWIGILSITVDLSIISQDKWSYFYLKVQSGKI